MVTEKEIDEWLFLDMLEKKISKKKETLSQKIRQDAARYLWQEGTGKKVYSTAKGVIYAQQSHTFRSLENLEPLKQIPQALQHLKTTISFDGSKMTHSERIKLQEFIKNSFAPTPIFITYKRALTSTFVDILPKISTTFEQYETIRSVTGHYQISLTSKPKPTTTEVQCLNCNIPVTIVEHRDRKLYHCVVCDWAEPFS